MIMGRRAVLLGALATVAGCARPGDPGPIVYRVGPDFDQSSAPIVTRPKQLVNPSQIEIRRMRYNGAHPAGTVIVNPQAKKLYLIQPNGYAYEYPIGIGKIGLNANYDGLYIARKAKNPTWTPTEDMHDQRAYVRSLDPSIPKLPKEVAGGAPNNPMGSHAIYFYYVSTGSDSILRAHGTDEAARITVGTEASSGCFRLLNEHAGHLYDNTHIVGAPSDPTNKARVVPFTGGLLTPGIEYMSAVIVNPYLPTMGMGSVSARP